MYDEVQEKLLIENGEFFYRKSANDVPQRCYGIVQIRIALPIEAEDTLQFYPFLPCRIPNAKGPSKAYYATCYTCLLNKSTTKCR